MMSDERVENKRYIKRIQQEAKEREFDERITRAEQEKILKRKQLEQEQKLAMVWLILYLNHSSMLISPAGTGKVEAKGDTRFEVSTKNQRD